MKFGMFLTTDFVGTILAASLITTLFFGGWQVPFLDDSGFLFPGGWAWELPTGLIMLLQMGSFLGKVFFFCFIMLLIRWTLPRFRWIS